MAFARFNYTATDAKKEFKNTIAIKNINLKEQIVLLH
jgi:hypothetical protein